MIKAMGTKLHYIRTHHPQAYGRSERVNQCFQLYLRYAAQDNPCPWRRWIAMANLLCNSSFSYSLDARHSKLSVIPEKIDTMPNVSVANTSPILDTTLGRERANTIVAYTSDLNFTIHKEKK
jgi:hypothetical protein